MFIDAQRQTYLQDVLRRALGMSLHKIRNSAGYRSLIEILFLDV